MNAAGLALGLIWVAKLGVRRITGWQPPHLSGGRRRVLNLAAVLTLLVLAWCLVSAIKTGASSFPRPARSNFRILPPLAPAQLRRPEYLGHLLAGPGARSAYFGRYGTGCWPAVPPGRRGAIRRGRAADTRDPALTDNPAPLAWRPRGSLPQRRVARRCRASCNDSPVRPACSGGGSPRRMRPSKRPLVRFAYRGNAAQYLNLLADLPGTVVRSSACGMGTKTRLRFRRRGVPDPRRHLHGGDRAGALEPGLRWWSA